MKKFYLIFSLVVGFNNLFSLDFQEFDTYQYKLTYEEVEKKIKNYLEKDPEIENFYRLTSQSLSIGDLERQQIDYVLYLSEETSDVSQKRCLRHCGLKGARIAIDPGHLGGAFAELEERCVKVPASKTKNGEEICFSEGELTYLTAVELKRLLEAEGAVVFLTRKGIGKGALEEDFFSWMRRHSDLKTENLSKIFRTYYNREDLRKRAEKINDFSPDITLVIHYNAYLTAAEQETKAFFTQSNYNLAFVPGAFDSGELKHREDRYEFLRLLVTDTIEESLKLSGYVVREFVHHLNVPLITQKDTAPYTQKACFIQEPGVYCRNLALTRLVHSPLCYGETLIQNHEEEVYRLAARDVFIMGIACSSRIKEVAQAYCEGIKQYFNHRE